MNVTGVDFTIVPITDFERSKNFYGEVLGLEESKQWGEMPAQEYETGNLTIAIMQPDAKKVVAWRRSARIAASKIRGSRVTICCIQARR